MRLRRTPLWLLGLALTALGCANPGAETMTAMDACIAPDERCDEVCGDVLCGSEETCGDCAEECYQCLSACDGDGVCELGETCEACAEDCGVCDGGMPCERLNAALPGELVVISGEMGDDWAEEGFGCDVEAHAPSVTVTGSWSGDVRCHGCDGWVFDNVEVSDGSLRMTAGDSWTIRDSTIDGGGRGIVAVVGAGTDGAKSQATNWLIERVTSRNAGCRPADDPDATHVRALYIIGENGAPSFGVVRDSTFEGEGCGATVKIGGSGDFGSWPGAPDAVDHVVFRGNTIRNVGEGAEQTALLLTTNSDYLTIARNTLISGEHAIVASGPWSGEELEVRDNVIDAPVFMLGRLWKKPEAGADAWLFGEKLVTYADPGECPEVGTCVGNTRG